MVYVRNIVVLWTGSVASISIISENMGHKFNKVAFTQNEEFIQNTLILINDS